VLLKEEQKLFKLLKGYVSGNISREKFTYSYCELLPLLESKLDKGLYHPLHVIVPTEDNSERAWKEDMRDMYLREIKNLDELVEKDEPSYAEKLSEEQQKALCQEAIQSIPKVALERSSIEWVKNNLIKDDEFVFIDEENNSRFDSYDVLYKACLVRKSFIMTAFSGGLPKLDYDYTLLINSLKKKVDGNTVWIRCSESDGLTAVDGTTWYTDPAEEIENLNWLEYTDPQMIQWGVCHLLFIPSNREWMLVHSNDFEGFSITLHGTGAFVSDVLNELNNA